MSNDDYPDVELVLGASSLAGDVSGSYRGLLGLTNEFYNEVFSDYKGFDGFMIVPVLLRPKSRGRLILRNSDPWNPPIVDINYYDHEDDLNTMVQAIKIVSRGSLCINIFYIYLTTFLRFSLHWITTIISLFLSLSLIKKYILYVIKASFFLLSFSTFILRFFFIYFTLLLYNILSFFQTHLELHSVRNEILRYKALLSFLSFFNFNYVFFTCRRRSK